MWYLIDLGIVQQLELRVEEYSGQTLYIFNKLAELSFDKEKLYNLSLIVGIRVILLTIEYDEELET